MFNLPYFLEGISNIFKPVLTDESPIAEAKGAENYRGKLCFDSESCIGCGICIRVCAGDAITKDVKVVEGGQEISMNFDLSSCTFCGLCKDFCPKKAISLSNEILMVESDKKNLIVKGSFIKKLPPKPPAKPKAKVEEKIKIDPKQPVEDNKEIKLK